MNEIDEGGNGTSVIKEREFFIKNTFYSYLSSYGMYFLPLFTSFIIAKLISKDLWGFLIVALSYISLISIVLSLLPLGLLPSLSYHIAVYKGQNQKKNIKVLIKYALIQKILFIIPVFIISILIVIYFSDFFQINLGLYVHLLLVLSPLIIFNAIISVFKAINMGLDMFKTIFYMLVIKYMISFSGLIYLLLFVDPVKIEMIAFINIISALIPLLINGYLVLTKYRSIESKLDEKGLTFKESIIQSLKYGSYLSIGDTMMNTWEQFKIQTIGIFEASSWVTGFNASNHIITVPRQTITSLRDPMIISFSRLESNQDNDQIIRIFNVVFYFTTFIFMLLSGVFFFLSEFLLTFIYEPSYQIFSILIKILLISSLFKLLAPQVNSLIRAKNKVKFDPLHKVITLSFYVPLFLYGLINFGIIGALIGMLIGDICLFIIRIFICYKLFKIHFNLKKLFLFFLNFFLSLSIVFILDMYLLEKINYAILKNLNLLFFENLNLLSLTLFALIFIALTLLFKIFSYEDIEFLKTLFPKEKKLNKVLNKIFNFFERLMKKKESVEKRSNLNIN